LEPPDRRLGHLLERAGLLKEVAGAGNDLDLGRRRQLRGGVLVEFEDQRVVDANDEKGWGTDLGERALGEVGAAAPGNEGFYPVGSFGGGNERGCRAGACAIRTDIEAGRPVVLGK